MYVRTLTNKKSDSNTSPSLHGETHLQIKGKIFVVKNIESVEVLFPRRKILPPAEQPLDTPPVKTIKNKSAQSP